MSKDTPRFLSHCSPFPARKPYVVASAGAKLHGYRRLVQARKYDCERSPIQRLVLYALMRCRMELSVGT